MPEDIKEGPRTAKCVWALAASPIWNSHTPLHRLPHPDAVVAADGGSTLASRLGLTPDLVIGDLDSSDPALLASLEAAHVQVERYGHSTKLETDTELALLAALAWQPETIIVLGATGGRMDHTLANLLLLTHPALSSVDVRIVDGRQTALLAKPGRWNVLPAEPGDTVTLLPVGVAAKGVRTEGLEYPLSDETLLPGRGRGVSNVALCDAPRVYLGEGVMLVIVIGSKSQMEEKDGNVTDK